MYDPATVDESGDRVPVRGKRKRHEPSILVLPDELLVMIVKHFDHSATKYCLALSCKRLLAVVLEREPKGKPNLALQANNMNGPWKEQLMVALARGWVPKHKLKLCFACWRFMPYGHASKQKYYTMEKARPCHFRKKDWLENWEVKVWFRQIRAKKNDWTDFIADCRIRCPMCVLENHKIYVRNKQYRERVLQGPELKALDGLNGLEQGLASLSISSGRQPEQDSGW